MAKTFVFDTSTLILLAKVTILRAFAKANEIIITPCVKREALQKKDAEDAKIIQHLLENGIIKEYAANLQYATLMEDFNIEAGEAEALQAAFQKQCIIATDDWCAIKACKIIDMRFVTAIHCLLHLLQQGELEQEIALEKLKRLDYYGRYSAEIIKSAKKRIEGETHG